MLWSRFLFQLLANWILAIDASFVGWILRTNRTGNMVGFADNSVTPRNSASLLIARERIACNIVLGHYKPASAPSVVAR
jgi:hypothetical protein